jgi:hypothetical protein
MGKPKDDTPQRSDQAGERTGDSPDPATSRKEKMLHARIPENLDREIKRRAGSLGMSVSTVVRHVLLNTFNLVEDIVTDGTNVALSITGDTPEGGSSTKPRGDAGSSSPEQIIGWQEVTLNINAVCDHCNAILATGTRAAIGIREQPGPRTIICTKCLPAAPGSATHD